MKGIELPINILIIVAVAVIVLIALVAMFYPAFSSSSAVVTSESTKSSACQILVEAKNCLVNPQTITIEKFDANRNGQVGIAEATQNFNPALNICNSTTVAGENGDNLATLCYCYYSATTDAKCKALCGC